MLPRRVIYGVSFGLMRLYYLLKPKRVEILHANIKKGFPDQSQEERVNFGKEVYRQVSLTMAELVLIYVDRLDIDKVITNKEEVIKKLSHLNKEADSGIIYIMAHYGNWELLGHFMAKNGYPLVGVVKEGRNQWIEQNILIPFRAKYGNTSVGHRASMLAISKALKARKSVSLAIDQVVQPPNGVVVNFFGHRTAATKAIAALKIKYNPKVVPIFLQREGEQFRVIIRDPIDVEIDNTVDKEERIAIMTQAYYDVIESQIRQSPTQWLWFYNRWKQIRYVS